MTYRRGTRAWIFGRSGTGDAGDTVDVVADLDKGSLSGAETTQAIR